MKKINITIINRTKFQTKDIKQIVDEILQRQIVPNFYLLCEPLDCNGITLTNLDKPTIIIFITNLGQFAQTFVHELTHIQQHADNYVDENEANKREIVVSDENNIKGTTIR